MAKEWHNTLCSDLIAEFGNERAIRPVEGVAEGIQRLIDAGWYIDIYSGRSKTLDGRDFMRGYFKAYLPSLEEHFVSDRIALPEHKPTAKIYVDDRGFKFNGWHELTPQTCDDYRAWWQHPASTQ